MHDRKKSVNPVRSSREALNPNPAFAKTDQHSSSWQAMEHSASNGAKTQRGITLIELALAVSLILLIALVALPSFTARRTRNDLEHTTLRMESLLREAQNRSVTQTFDSSWGVHFENATSILPFFSLFYSSYSASTTIRRETLSVALRYATSTIAEGQAIDITFEQLTGFLTTSSVSLSLHLVQNPAIFSTIVVATSGLVTAIY